MKKLKRAISFILIITMISVVFSITSLAATSQSDFIVEDGVLKKYTGSSAKVIIPDNLGITEIGRGVFFRNKNITEVSIPNGVTNIGYQAFYECTELTSVSLPDGLLLIDDSAFLSCISLASLNIPDSVRIIEGYAFYNCSKLTSLNIPNSVKYIGKCAFFACGNLSSISLSDNIGVLNKSLFRNCQSLKSVTVPSSVKYVDEEVFRDCFNLESITFLGDQVRIETNFNIDSSAIKGGEQKTKPKFYGIKGSIVEVFANSNNIPFSVITSTSKSDNTISADDFIIENGVLTRYIGKESNVVIPDDIGINEIGESAFQCEKLITFIKIPEGVKKISAYAFINCDYLNTIELPSTLLRIDVQAFFHCDRLISIELPVNLTYLGISAFQSCSSLCSIAIPDGVTDLYQNTFSECQNLSSIIIPSSVCYISEDLFSNDSDNLDKAEISNPTVYVEKGSFAETAIKNIGKEYISLDTIEKTSKNRINVTPKEISVLLDKTPIKFTVININGNNYFNLFDLAKALSTTTMSINPSIGTWSWVYVKAGQYTPNGTEFTLKANGSTISVLPFKMKLIGESHMTTTGYLSNNGLYIKIKDLADQIGFSVSWDQSTKTINISTK